MSSRIFQDEGSVCRLRIAPAPFSTGKRGDDRVRCMIRIGGGQMLHPCHFGGSLHAPGVLRWKHDARAAQAAGVTVRSGSDGWWPGLPLRLVRWNVRVRCRMGGVLPHTPQAFTN